MPFAIKFRATMGFPFPGDELDGLVVESVDVRNIHGGRGGYRYDVHMVLCGPGGQAAVRQAIKPLCEAHPTTFSGYGNPYQLWLQKPEIESLGDKRYAISAQGAGARIWLKQELVRLLDYMDERGALPEELDLPAREAFLSAYLGEYTHEIRLMVGRYQSKVRRLEKGAAE